MDNFFSIVTIEIVLTVILVVLTPLMAWIGLSLKKTRAVIYELRDAMKDMHTEAITEMRNHNKMSEDSVALLRQLQLDAVENRKDHQQLMTELQRRNNSGD